MMLMNSLFPKKKANTKKSGEMADNKSRDNKTVISQNVSEVGGSSSNVESSKNVNLFLEPETILKREQCVYLVGQIKEIAGLNDNLFDLYYKPAILSFARLCQSVGASERHHHSEPYGLIEHSLEVAMYAMRKSQGAVYFPDREVETIQWLERVFMYSCFIGGLLHDGGKIYTNFKWFTRNERNKWKLWNPMIHQIPKEHEQVEYRITTYKNKSGLNVYHQSSHELFASNLFQDVVPQAGLEWIIGYSDTHAAELFIDLIHTIGSDYALGHELGECVKHADQVSTDDGIRRHHAINRNSSFVDLQDPNLPVYESFLAVIKDVIASPDSFNLVTNKVAMGKYSQMERYGDLIFLSAKSVLPIIKKRLSDTNIRLPNDQAIFTLLVDNGVTLPAPSGDTFWWIEFFSTNNANKSKEMSYFVIDAHKLTEIGIDDLRSFEVQYRISDKSLAMCEDDEDEVLEYSEENYPEVWSLFHDSDFELFKKPNKGSSVKEEAEVSYESNENTNQDDDANDKDEEDVSHIAEDVDSSVGTKANDTVMSFGKAQDNPETSSELPESAAVASPPTNTPVIKTTPATPPPVTVVSVPKTSNVNKNRTTPATPPTASVSAPKTNKTKQAKSTANTTNTSNQKKKPAPKKKSNTSQGSILDKAIGIGLGLNKSNVSTSEPKVNSSKVNSNSNQPKQKTQAQQAASTDKKVKIENEAPRTALVEPNQPKVDDSASVPPTVPYDAFNLPEPPIFDVPNYSDDDYVNQMEMVDYDVGITINDTEGYVDENQRPFESDTKVTTPPRKVELSEKMVKLLARNHSLGCASDTKVYDQDVEQKVLTNLLCTWIPYIEAGIEQGSISSNVPGSHVLHLREGLFFSRDKFKETFCESLTRDLFSQLERSAATLMKDDKSVLEIIHENGNVQSGYILTVRALLPGGKNMPLYREAKLK
ncbi:TraI domain-containing protein [Vibrio cyclitrophicus]|uniref:TraI domain-containing protein n=1 Tax=Vibrio cyclitrophicus TaxID=47951 RepID=UPI0032E36F9C